MKKSYTKPIITFECLAASPRIASSCALINTNNAQFECPVLNEETGWTLFTYACDFEVDPDSVCYDVPMDDGKIFQS